MDLLVCGRNHEEAGTQGMLKSLKWREGVRTGGLPGMIKLLSPYSHKDNQSFWEEEFITTNYSSMFQK